MILYASRSPRVHFPGRLTGFPPPLAAVQCPIAAMTTPHTTHNPQRILIWLPNWVGDVVMATPTLRALRLIHPKAHITWLVRPYLKPLIDACPWYDRLMSLRGESGLLARSRATRSGRTLPADRRRTWPALVARLRAGRFDQAILLPNSFRSAAMTRLAGIGRIIGYGRDGRSWLLTDRLSPPREGRRFIPTSTLHYYLQIARHQAASIADDSPSASARLYSPEMELFTHPADDARADRLLRAAGITPGLDRLLLLNPGAAFGSAKMWAPERFAAVADDLAARYNLRPMVSGAPSERPILDAVRAAARTPIIDLPALGCDLRLLKSILRHVNLMITNDTGPRHMAAAMNVPVVTLFGPTDPRWAAIDFPLERMLRLDLPCSPCQRKICPLGHHKCMKGIEPPAVSDLAGQLLASPLLGTEGRA